MTAIRAPSGAHSNASTSTPVAVRAVGRGGFGSVAGPAAARDGRVDQPDLRPAAPARQEGEPMAVRRPARRAAAAGLAGDAGEARPVRLDDPDLVVADEREAAAVGRPLRIGDGLLRRGELGRIAAAQRQREELAGAGGLGGVGHDPVARVEAELARGVDRDDRLDRQVRRRRGGGGRHQASSPLGVERRRTTARSSRGACGRGRGGSRTPSSSRRASAGPRPTAGATASSSSARAAVVAGERPIDRGRPSRDLATIRSFQSSMPSSGSASQ